MRGMIVLLVLSALMMAAPPSQADTVYNSFPANVEKRGDFGRFGPGYIREYAVFSVPVTSDFYFTGLDIALGYRGGPNDMFIGLFADNANYPACALESFRLTDVVQPMASGGSIITLNSTLKPALKTSGKYWIGVWVADEALTGMTWYHAQSSVLGPGDSRALYRGSAGWSLDAATMSFRVRGDKRVTIAIGPGSDTSSINLSSRAIPVAVFGSNIFDVTSIDPQTVRLAGAQIMAVGRKRKLLSHYDDINGDGYVDFVCQVVTQQLILEPGVSTAFLEALTYDGRHIRGEYSVLVLDH